VPLGSDFADLASGQHIGVVPRKELEKKSRQLHRKGQVAFSDATDAEAIEAMFVLAGAPIGLESLGATDTCDRLNRLLPRIVGKTYDSLKGISWVWVHVNDRIVDIN
jgi:hypothetical protein